MILIIDNYDSFTYNIVQYMGELGAELVVWRNDQFEIPDIGELNPDGIVISPGPCSPNEAGLSLAVLENYATQKPIFGICLGHQCMGQHFGGKVIHADRLMHGKVSSINHRGISIFEGIEDPFIATRYHSLIVERSSFPDELEILAETDEGEIMALRHKSLPVFGVQFHPESYSTNAGKMILGNFLKQVEAVKV